MRHVVTNVRYSLNYKHHTRTSATAKGRSKRKRQFRNSLEIYEFPASLGVYIGVRYQPLDYSRILPWLIVRPCPTLGSAVAFQRYPRITPQPGRPGVSSEGSPLPWYSLLRSHVQKVIPIVVILTVRAGHGGESFVGMMHLQWYVYIQQWWYNSRVYARIAALLAVRTGHTAVV